MTVSNPYQSPTTTDLKSSFADGDSVSIRHQFFKTERAFHAIGTAYFGVAFLIGAALLATCVAGWRIGNTGTVLIAGVLFLPLVSINLMIGRGLRQLESWVRGPSTLAALLLLIYLPLGTIIGAATLFLVYSEAGKQVLSENYRRVIEATPEIATSHRFSYPILVAFAILSIALIAIWFEF